MIWSSLARNRSLSPVVARCLGRIVTLRCAANHGWTPRRIAKNEIARFRRLMAPYLAIPNPLSAPKPIPDQLPTEFFTGDIITPSSEHHGSPVGLAWCRRPHVSCSARLRPLLAAGPPHLL